MQSGKYEGFEFSQRLFTDLVSQAETRRPGCAAGKAHAAADRDEVNNAGVVLLLSLDLSFDTGIPSKTATKRKPR